MKIPDIFAGMPHVLKRRKTAELIYLNAFSPLRRSRHSPNFATFDSCRGLIVGRFVPIASIWRLARNELDESADCIRHNLATTSSCSVYTHPGVWKFRKGKRSQTCTLPECRASAPRDVCLPFDWKELRYEEIRTSVGNYAVVAKYNGDANYLPAKYTAVTQVVNP